MKKVFVALMAGILFPAGVFAASTLAPGTYAARLNLNIRSMPSVSGSLIGHYNQGDAVNVLKVLGSWCQVDRYKAAYVYCSYLSPSNSNGIQFIPPAGQVSSSTASNGSVTQLLTDAQHWILTNSEGADYINNSFFQSREKALTWDGEAKLADFYFQWPMLSDSKCTMTFSGPFHDHEVMKSACFDSAGVIKTWNENVTKPQTGYDLPVMPMKVFVADLLADKNLLGNFDAYFAGAKSVKGLFRLYKDAAGVLRWEGKFIDDASGRFMIVSTDAMQLMPAFQTKSGMFQ